MNPVDWAGGDAVLTCQLVSAAALAAHLLILRPRAASRDLLLDAGIVQDELDLAERLGHISSTDVETIALQQLLCRVRRNPGSTGLVLARIPALARSVGYRTGSAEAEYLLGALDRLSDAGRRYLRTAWPRTGTLAAAMTSAPAIGRDLEPDLEPVRYLDDDLDFADDVRSYDVRSYDVRTDEALVDDATTDAGGRDDATTDAGNGDDARVDAVSASDAGDDLDHYDARRDLSDLDQAPPSEPARKATLRADADRSAAGAGKNPGAPSDHELDRYSGSRAGRDGEPADPELSEPDGAPAWVDLVRAETPRRNSGLGQADRHARPYRPARSSGHAASRRIEQPDRSSVLPR